MKISNVVSITKNKQNKQTEYNKPRDLSFKKCLDKEIERIKNEKYIWN